MIKIPAAKSSTFKLPEEGTHLVEIIQLAELGLQKQVFKGQEKIQSKLFIRFALLEELTDDGKPLVKDEQLTLSTHPKAQLSELVGAISGFSLEKHGINGLLGKHLILTIAHKPGRDGRVFANAKGYSKVKASVKIPTVKVEHVLYELEEGLDSDSFKKLPPYIQEKIINRLDMSNEEAMLSVDDEVPFN